MIKFFENLYISAIEIKNGINNKGIEYLSHDLNYKEGGYKQYKEITCLHYPGGKNLNAQYGNIIDIKVDLNLSTIYQLIMAHQGLLLLYQILKK